MEQVLEIAKILDFTSEFASLLACNFEKEAQYLLCLQFAVDQGYNEIDAELVFSRIFTESVVTPNIAKEWRSLFYPSSIPNPWANCERNSRPKVSLCHPRRSRRQRRVYATGKYKWQQQELSQDRLYYHSR